MGVVDLDTDKGHVFVRQDWRYEWTNKAGTSPWTIRERNAFHHALDRQIWKFWSLRLAIKVQRTTEPAPARIEPWIDRSLSLSFDIRRVLTGGAWTVTATKVNPASPRDFPRADTTFEARRMQLFSTDTTPHHALRFPYDPMRRPNNDFFVGPHEFGHALGYGNSRGDGEEYRPENPYFNDTLSLMNIGLYVRPRHVRLIVETLASMVGGVRFVAAEVPK